MRPVPATIRTALLAAATIVLAACASGPEMRRDTNPTANFANYKTFGFFSPLATDRAGYESVFTGRLKAATRRAMESRGYVYSETDPDLLLNFFANVEDKQEIRTMPVSMGGYYGYRSGFYGGYTATQGDPGPAWDTTGICARAPSAEPDSSSASLADPRA